MTACRDSGFHFMPEAKMRSLRRRQMRYGLHSFTRRVWVSKGVRPVAPSQQRYEWGYL